VTLKNLKLLRNLTLRQLRVFLAAARHLSFAKAAEELNLTAPAVSMQIKEMEGDLGVEVFARTGRRVELTTAGEYFLSMQNASLPHCARPRSPYPSCGVQNPGRYGLDWSVPPNTSCPSSLLGSDKSISVCKSGSRCVIATKWSNC